MKYLRLRGILLMYMHAGGLFVRLLKGAFMFKDSEKIRAAIFDVDGTLFKQHTHVE